jgi:hypothetical protein
MSSFASDDWVVSVPSPESFGHRQQYGLPSTPQSPLLVWAARGLWRRLGDIPGGRTAYLLTLLVWAIVGTIGIYASVYTTSDERTCLAPYHGLSFDMIVWLQVFGWTSIGVVSTLLLFVLIAVCCDNHRSDVLAWRLVSFAFLFHFAW